MAVANSISSNNLDQSRETPVTSEAKLTNHPRRVPHYKLLDRNSRSRREGTGGASSGYDLRELRAAVS
jgi:hypothetical protein